MEPEEQQKRPKRKRSEGDDTDATSACEDTDATSARSVVVVRKKKSVQWTATEDQRLRTIIAEEQRQRKGKQIRWAQVAEAHPGLLP
mmetsp:Transcript_17768/g.41965  ORF Transcript_17768/g.41965 Transcript_17768/m.41965 type:complete len:87 (-) Transcript_17768:4-264(-)